MKKYKIAVAGTGYVGLSIATLLSQHHHVTAVDILPEKVVLINARKSPIRDDYIEKYLAEKELDLTATLDAKAAYTDADFVVIAAPTNYDSQTQHFDTSAVEAVIRLVTDVNPNAVMVIKSTIPVATRCRCGKGSAAGTSCSARNFCGSPRPCMTTSTRPASSSAPTRRMRTLSQPPTNLRHCCKRGPSRRTLIRSSWALPSRGRQAVRQHLSGAARCLFQ